MAASAGADSILLTNPPGAEAVAGALIKTSTGNIVGEIASVSGNTLTLAAPLNHAVKSDDLLTYVDGTANTWQLITDFDDADEAGNPTVNSTIVGTKVWAPDSDVPGFVGGEADPSPWTGDEGNIALHVDHNNTATMGMETAYILMPEDIVDGTTATIYFRWWMDKNGGHETAISLTDTFNEGPYNTGDTPNATITNGYGDHKTWWRIAGEFSLADFAYSSSNNEANRETAPVIAHLGAADSGWSYNSAIAENQAYQPGVWMEMWYIMDTENDTRIEYQIQNDGVMKQNSWAILDENGDRQGDLVTELPQQLGPTDLDYTGIYMVNWSRPLPNYDTQVYMDDLWIFYGDRNLTTPPHGKTRSTVELDTTSLAVAVGAGADSILLTNPPPATAVVGAVVKLADGTIVGTIASIAGNTLNLEGLTPAAIPAGDVLTYDDTITDTTFRGEAADAGATTITMNDVSGAAVGNLAFLFDGTELGRIASIDGNVITLKDPLAAAITAGTPITFVEDDSFPIEDGGNVLNISTRGIVGSGDNVMIGGFIITDGPQTVFVAARAQELAAANVPNLLSDPVLTINPQGDNETILLQNDNWQDDAEEAQVITDIWGGSPPLEDGSTSAAGVVTLPAGAYTGTISAADGSTDGGLAIFEVFEVNEQ